MRYTIDNNLIGVLLMADSQNTIPESTAFHCPACQAPIEYGIKRCPGCQTAIFYRDMSETFWNDRKLNLFKQTNAIQRGNWLKLTIQPSLFVTVFLIVNN